VHGPLFAAAPRRCPAPACAPRRGGVPRPPARRAAAGADN